MHSLLFWEGNLNNGKKNRNELKRDVRGTKFAHIILIINILKTASIGKNPA